MPGPLVHAVADIVSRLLVELAVGSDPDNNPLQAWPVYYDSEPAEPAEIITVYGTEGRSSGRIMSSGERQEHHGVQIRIRANTAHARDAKARAICVALDEEVNHTEITIQLTDYVVWNVSRTSDLIRMPNDAPATKRRVAVINAIVSVRQL